VELKQMDSVTLDRRQSRNRLPQLFYVAVPIHIWIRRFLGKGYGQVFNLNLMRRASCMAAGSVDKAIPYDCKQPRHKGPFGIVTCANSMYREQDVLDQVFDVFDLKKRPPAANNAPNTRRNFFPKKQIRPRITGLCRPHQFRQIVVANEWLSHSVLMPTLAEDSA